MSLQLPFTVPNSWMSKVSPELCMFSLSWTSRSDLDESSLSFVAFFQFLTSLDKFLPLWSHSRNVSCTQCLFSIGQDFTSRSQFFKLVSLKSKEELRSIESLCNFNVVEASNWTSFLEVLSLRSLDGGHEVWRSVSILHICSFVHLLFFLWGFFCSLPLADCCYVSDWRSQGYNCVH